MAFMELIVLKKIWKEKVIKSPARFEHLKEIILEVIVYFARKYVTTWRCRHNMEVSHTILT